MLRTSSWEFSRLLSLQKSYSLIMEDNTAAWPYMNQNVTLPLMTSLFRMLSAASKSFDLEYE